MASRRVEGLRVEQGGLEINGHNFLVEGFYRPTPSLLGLRIAQMLVVLVLGLRVRVVELRVEVGQLGRVLFGLVEGASKNRR